jgi:hypothetical protein
MTPKQFDKAALKLFGPVLQGHGFTTERSRLCTFHRKISDEMYHLIMPSLGSRGAWYRVMVFPASPAIDPTFFEHFPDDLGAPSDSWSYLSEQGISLGTEQFNCNSEENFVRRFENTVRDLLTDIAVPYLDQFKQVADMLPIIKQPGFMGLALHHVGRVTEARPILEKERNRLTATGSSERVVTALIERIDELLQLA